MSEQKIIDRIRKLLNLANSANEHEAALAAAQATDLMLKHEIEEAQLADEGAEELGEVDKESIDETGSIVPWKGNIAAGLAQSMGCQMYYGRSKYVRGQKQKRTYVIIGQESKRATIKYMYNYLCAELIRLADIAFRQAILKHRAEEKEYRASGLSMGPPPSARSWKNAFRLGAASMIWTRLNAQRKETHRGAEAAGQTQALMVVAKNEEAVQVWIKANLGKLGKGRAGSFSSGSGYGAGREAGKTVGLGGSGKALGRGTAKQLGS
jgi:hypothetical protein